MVGLAATKNRSSPICSISSARISLSLLSLSVKERAPDRGFKLLRPQRANQIILRSQANRFQLLAGIVGAGQHQHGKIGTDPAQPAQSVQALGVAAQQIEQNQIRTGSGLDALQGFPAAARGFQLPARVFSRGSRRDREPIFPCSPVKFGLIPWNFRPRGETPYNNS